MGSQPTPRYDLLQVKLLIRQGRYEITATAAWEAMALGFDEDDILECVCGLTPQLLHKSMPSEKRAGMWQDVYRVKLGRRTIYLKLQMEDEELVVVIQFKEK
jgi:motility quorum-sensing regulator/GCU-specific mRNA interferase toxin